MNTTFSIIGVTQLNDELTLDTAQNSAKPIKILYTTMQTGAGLKPDIVTQHANEYIPQSIAFDFQTQFAKTNSQLSNSMISAQEFQREARKLGLNNEDTIVVYDDYGNFCASRVWFMFKSMGHNNVLLLDGGLPAWLRAKYITVSKLLEPSERGIGGNFEAKPDKAFKFVGKQDIVNNLSSFQCQVLDARSPDRFKGLIPEANEQLRAGHIPQSKSLHYAKLLDEEGKFLALDKIKQQFEPIMHMPLMFSCGSGVTACILAQAATMIGINEVQVYDGSWSEWGADNTLPIETGE